MAKMPEKQFIATIAPACVKMRREGSPIFPSLRIAQALLETGGNIHPWFNLSGIKAIGGRTPFWDGRYVEKETWEEANGKPYKTVAKFRAYISLEQYFRDQELLYGRPRYSAMCASKTPEDQIKALGASGWATDSRYAEKILNLWKKHELSKYDQEADQPQPIKATIQYKGQSFPGLLIEGTTWGPARTICAAVGGKVGWTGTEVTVNGKLLPTLVVGKVGYVQVRKLAEVLQLGVTWDGKANTATMG